MVYTIIENNPIFLKYFNEAILLCIVYRWFSNNIFVHSVKKSSIQSRPIEPKWAVLSTGNEHRHTDTDTDTDTHTITIIIIYIYELNFYKRDYLKQNKLSATGGCIHHNDSAT